jgi:OMF family outer membrane factor
MKKRISLIIILFASFFTHSIYSQKILNLDECVKQALQYNKQVKIAENNVLKSTYQREEILSNLWPKINGNVDYKYYFDLPTQLMPAKAFNPMAPEWEFKAAQFGVPHNINANLQVGMPLYNADLYSGIKISKVAEELQKINYKKTKEDTYVLISNLYYNAQIIKNQILYTKKNRENLNKLLKDLQLFYEQKMVTKNEVDKVALQVKKLDVNLKLLHNTYKEVINALKLNMGINEDFDVQTEIITPQLKVYPSQTPTNVLLLEKKYDLTDLEIKKIKNGRLPKLSAFGSYGTIGYGYDEKPHDFLDFYDVSLIGVKLEIPFLDLSRKKKIQQKEVELDNAKLQMELVKEKNEIDIKNAQNKLQVQLEVIENQKEQIKLAKSVYNKTLMQHKQDMASLTDVLLAENDIIKAEQEYLSSVIEYLKTNLELKKLTGNLIQ